MYDKWGFFLLITMTADTYLSDFCCDVHWQSPSPFSKMISHDELAISH